MDLYYKNERIIGENDLKNSLLEIPNLNILYNWFLMNPVNRLGKTKYTNAGYTVDGWNQLYSNKTDTYTEITPSGLKCGIEASTSMVAGIHRISQSIKNSELYRGKTLTFSALRAPESTSGQFVLLLKYRLSGESSDRYFVSNPADDELNVYTVKVPDNCVALWVEITSTDMRQEASGKYTILKAAKLELGSVQTLAHKEGNDWVLNEIPNYAEQYVICEQYSLSTGEFIGSRHSNPNLLDNWYFVGGGSQQGGEQFPVNQLGETAYKGGGYTIDRWTNLVSADTGNVRLTKYGIELDSTNVANVFSQIIEHDRLLPDTTYTFSILADQAEGCVLGFSEHTWPYTDMASRVPIADGVTSITFKVSKSTFESYSGYWRAMAAICDMNGHHLIIKAVKLELGDHQTLAHQDEDGNWILNEIPNYAEQYMICSQYSPSTGEFIGSQHSNPNLLDNWYFVNPVNQRGEKEYINGVYGIDRWQAYTGTTVYVDDGCIRLSQISTNNNDAFLRQAIENFASFAGKTMTISLLVKSSTAMGVRIRLNDDVASSTSKYTTEGLISTTLKISDNPRSLVYTIRGEINTEYSTKIIAAKLELGPIQTLAHKEGDQWVLNDPPPNYQQELAKCQRYQLFISSANIPASYITANNIEFFIPTPVTMRSIPVFSDGVVVYAGNTVLPESGFTFARGVSSNGIKVVATKNGHGLTSALLRLTDALFDANV